MARLTASGLGPHVGHRWCSLMHLFNCIGNAYFLEYNSITKIFFVPQYVSRCFTNMIQLPLLHFTQLL